MPLSSRRSSTRGLPYETRHALATMARAENMLVDVLHKIVLYKRLSQTAMCSGLTAQEQATY